MEQKEKPIDNFKGAIIAFLFAGTGPLSPKGELQYLAKYYPVNAVMAINQLLAEGLIKKEENGDISLTPKGYKVIQIYGNYRKYIDTLEKQRIDKEKEKQLDSKVKKSTIFSNYLNATSAICSIVGFIVGILSADQIKRILAWLLSNA